MQLQFTDFSDRSTIAVESDKRQTQADQRQSQHLQKLFFVEQGLRYRNELLLAGY